MKRAYKKLIFVVITCFKNNRTSKYSEIRKCYETHMYQYITVIFPLCGTVDNDFTINQSHSSKSIIIGERFFIEINISMQ